jgi:Bacterial Ig-like domain (group 3)/Legume lectin domain/Chitobiase/beta-hexosaminidase C-terminal domain
MIPLIALRSCDTQNTRGNSLRELGWVGLVLGVFILTASARAQTAILTQHYDNARTGQNTEETILTPTNVSTPASFGKLFALPVTGYVYAQPLYVPGVAIAGKGTHNVLYVATEHDLVYAFDADTEGAPLWTVSFLNANATTVPNGDVSTNDIVPEIGITGTPAIDPNTNTLYVVAKTKENGQYIHRLHALDISTGAEKFGAPIVLSASVPGTGDGGSTVTFSDQWENQRPGLLVNNGYVFIGFAAHGDNGPWHGWILAYNVNPATGLLQSTGVWNTSPNGRGNGIWASGSGIAADASGNAYIATGNGDYSFNSTAPPPSTSVDFGDSVVKFSLTNGVPVPTDYFTPYNQQSLTDADSDLGSGGVIVVPDQTGSTPHVLVVAGKQGRLYVINRDQMTKNNSHYCNGCSSDPEILQTVDGIGGLWSMPAYWNGNMYFWGNGDNLKAYSMTAGALSASPTSQSAESSGFPGSTPVVSSNGTANGIVWAVESDGYNSNSPAILRAYDATDVGNLLYASNLTGDTLGAAVKFVVPVVINGKVYVGTQREVDVFGLTNGEARAAAPVFNPASGSYGPGLQVTLTSATSGASIFYTTDGSSPSTASTLYTGAIPVNTTTTINAIAVENGFLESTISTATFTISSETAVPQATPAAGTYTTKQSIALADTTANATIYYTTNGTTPTVNSTKYNPASPIQVASTTTIKAIASAPNLNNSPVLTAVYTINPSATSSINFGSGFSNPAGLQFNGSTDLDDSRLQLTNGGTNEAASAFYTSLVDVGNFTSDFTFQLSDPAADGFTFTIQNSPSAAKALGPSGGGLGYGPDSPSGPAGIPQSVAIKYDLYNNNGEGVDSTGLYTDGASPTTPAIDLTPSGIDLHSGDTMGVHLAYDGTTLAMTITDNVAGATFSQSWPINIPQVVGAEQAYVGFTAGTGGETSSQKIETWTYVGTNTSSPVPTTTTLVSSANPVYVGQSLTFTATVASSASPTGSITFRQGNTILATVALASRQAVYSTSYSAAGSHSITASYSGDANDQASTSAALAQVVRKLPAVTATNLSSSLNPSLAGQSVTFTAQVTSSYGALPDGETITFERGATVIGTAPLSGGVATFTTAALVSGNAGIKASYGGDGTYAPSASKILTQVINKNATNISVTASPNPSILKQVITFTATVTSSGPTPTGTVIFQDEKGELGSAQLNGGVATFSKSTLLAGSYSITATYKGDSASLTSTSAAFTQLVNK